VSVLAFSVLITRTSQCQLALTVCHLQVGWQHIAACTCMTLHAEVWVFAAVLPAVFACMALSRGRQSASWLMLSMHEGSDHEGVCWVVGGWLKGKTVPAGTMSVYHLQVRPACIRLCIAIHSLVLLHLPIWTMRELCLRVWLDREEATVPAG
jgi:hypothetical protein